MKKGLEEEDALASIPLNLELDIAQLDISDIEEEGESIHVFANAEIIDSHGESWLNEGCLSVPDIRLDIKRSNKITLKYQLLLLNLLNQIFQRAFQLQLQ